ncbi:DUF3313 domain-containing protein [Methylotuvimicrobium sp. KM1]|uniref:DUF3313 domain-containing protein n=1 Tax=Methylotuvimicrobium sp. KM1 TaxID=3377707 RepID=UPI00384B0ED0
MRNNNKRTKLGIFGLILVIPMLGCAPTKQARDVEPAGFLGDYSMLGEGKEGEALKIYLNPSYQSTCHNYDKVLIEPVRIWVSGNKDLAEMPLAERQVLVNHMHGSLVDELGKHYRIVRTPEPGTIRIRTAITEAEGSWVALDTVSSFVPQLLVMSTIKEVATGTATFVGRAGAEADITDAMTGERIAAAVDRRVGKKSYEGVTQQWDDVTRSFDYWAGRMAYRLANCGAMPPEQ